MEFLQYYQYCIFLWVGYLCRALVRWLGAFHRTLIPRKFIRKPPPLLHSLPQGLDKPVEPLAALGLRRRLLLWRDRRGDGEPEAYEEREAGTADSS